jgi:nucleoside triphosphate pyrophosphatase
MPSSSKKLILASRSPRRSELLRSLGLEFEVSPSKVDEITNPEQSPEQNATNIARDKARWVARQNPGSYVLGADTMVVLDQEIIGQPADEEDACRILSKLMGKQHRVITGVVLITPETEEYETAVVSRVTLKSVSENKIRSYIATGEPLDKAGAYAIQGEGSFLVDSWEGSYSNIVGLPLEALTNLFQQAGFPVPKKNEDNRK